MSLTKVSAGVLNIDDLYGFRNRIINGDMRIAQRGTAAVTTDYTFPVDRFAVAHSTDGAFSGQQDSEAPDGFVNSIKITATTADASLTGTQNLQLLQRIEGTTVSDLGFGTSAAKTVTVSFWVRSSLTGTFGGSLKNSANDRSYPFTYTINSADTWEYKSVTIPGDTSGTWLTTTGIGINLQFGLGSGPDRSGTAGAWASANYIQPTGSVSLIGTLNATWYVTGVQLEVGSVATPFERRPYGTELQLCQRYFEKSYEISVVPGTDIGATGYGSVYVTNSSDSGSNAVTTVKYAVTKRARPTITSYRPQGTSGSWDYGRSSVTGNATTTVFNDGQSSFAIYLNVGAANATSHIHGAWTASSEL
jgi:hypothetical protein